MPFNTDNYKVASIYKTICEDVSDDDILAGIQASEKYVKFSSVPVYRYYYDTDVSYETIRGGDLINEFDSGSLIGSVVRIKIAFDDKKIKSIDEMIAALYDGNVLDVEVEPDDEDEENIRYFITVNKKNLKWAMNRYYNYISGKTSYGDTSYDYEARGEEEFERRRDEGS
jgi:hypothetical protein